MIHEISFKNFYSFKDEGKISLRVNKQAPKSDFYFKSGDIRLNKVLLVIGPNASGKTNLLKVFSFLRWVIVDSFLEENQKKTMPIESFLFQEKKGSPTELSVVFEIKNELFKYKIILTKHRILSEALYKEGKRKGVFVYRFKRDWNKKEKKYTIKTQEYPLVDRFQEMVGEKVSLIPIAAKIKQQLSSEIVEYWNKVDTNVNWIGRKYDYPFIFDASYDFYRNKEQWKLANDILSDIDLGINGGEIETRKSIDINKNKVYYHPTWTHIVSGKKYKLPFFFESSGTENLFCLLSKILPVLEKGGVLILDEFDSNLHPYMTPVLINMFFSKKHNKNNAQLIFTTHNHYILKSLDKYQIVLIEKNKLQVSEPYRLDDVSGVRSDDNYYTKYMSGYYGAVPKL